MGYTHYWHRELEVEETMFRDIVKDFRKLLPYLEGSQLGGWDGTGDPVITESGVSFNGRGEQAHETFAFPKLYVPEPWEVPKNTGRWFAFCKTAGKRYDIAVCAFLIIAKQHLNSSLDVRSDGEIDEEWLDIRLLCDHVLGYGKNFVFSD